MLDKEIGWEKQTEVFPDASAAYALLSLLERHQDRPADRRAIRLLLKAEEEGKEKLEKTCAALHVEYAQLLRLRRGIPALYPYLRNILGRQER